MINRLYETNVDLGFGFGRIRNVNPVFEAIRFYERLKYLRNVEDLNDEDIKELAC